MLYLASYFVLVDTSYSHKLFIRFILLVLCLFLLVFCLYIYSLQESIIELSVSREDIDILQFCFVNNFRFNSKMFLNIMEFWPCQFSVFVFPTVCSVIIFDFSMYTQILFVFAKYLNNTYIKRKTYIELVVKCVVFVLVFVVTHITLQLFSNILLRYEKEDHNKKLQG